MKHERTAFTLAEVLLALGVVVLTILATTAFTIAVLRATQKTTDQPVGTLVAERLLSEEIYRAQSDSPPGARASFWDNDWVSTPFRTGTVRRNETDYQYWIYAETVNDLTTGQPLGNGGTVTNNRVKKVDIAVSWFGAQGGTRGGYGRLLRTATRLVNEAP